VSGLLGIIDYFMESCGPLCSKPIGKDPGLQLWSKMDQYFKDEEGLADSTRQRYR
jgi:hypothetical protein